MPSRRTRGIALPAATVVVLAGLTACGDDSPKLSDKQRQTAERLESDGHLAKKDAECIAGKLTGKALSAARHDSNFSELNGYEDGDKVAAAYSSCTGKNFENEYHYDPKS